MIFIQFLISAIILYIIYKLLRSMLKSIKQRKEVDELFIKS